MAEAVQAFLITQLVANTDALADDVLRHQRDDVTFAAARMGRAPEHGVEGQRARNSGSQAEAYANTGNAASNDNSRRTPQLEALVPWTDSPIMRRASWVEQLPHALHEAAGFGLPRTPLRVLSRGPGSKRHPLLQLADVQQQQQQQQQQTDPAGVKAYEGPGGAETAAAAAAAGAVQVTTATGTGAPTLEAALRSSRNARNAWGAAARAGRLDAPGTPTAPSRLQLTTAWGPDSPGRPGQESRDIRPSLQGPSEESSIGRRVDVAVFVTPLVVPQATSSDVLNDRVFSIDGSVASPSPLAGASAKGHEAGLFAAASSGKRPHPQQHSRGSFQQSMGSAPNSYSELPLASPRRQALDPRGEPTLRRGTSGRWFDRDPASGGGPVPRFADTAATGAVVPASSFAGQSQQACTPSAAAAAVANILWPEQDAAADAAARCRLGAIGRQNSRRPLTPGLVDRPGGSAVPTGLRLLPTSAPVTPTKPAGMLLPGQADGLLGAHGSNSSSQVAGKEPHRGIGPAGFPSAADEEDEDGGAALLTTLPKEVDWWLQAGAEELNDGHGMQPRRRRRQGKHRQGVSGGGGALGTCKDDLVTASVDSGSWEESARPGGTLGTSARDVMRATSVRGRQTGPKLDERVPWQWVILDLWGSIDRWLPLFMPSRGRDCWDGFILLLLLYTASVVPLEAGFLTFNLGPLEVLDDLVLGIFWADILVQFRTAYITETGELERNTRRIAAHYARTWLTLDVMSSLPWEALLRFVIVNASQHVGSLVTLVRLTRLLKLVRLLRLFDRFRYANLLRLGQLLGMMILVAHWTACIWHGMSEWLSGWPWIFDALLINGEDGFLAQYSYALYSSFVLVVGSDNIPAHNNVERVFYIVMLLVGAIIYALLVSNMAVLAANLNALSSRFRLKAVMAADALRYMGVPEDFRNRVSQYYEFLAHNEHPGAEADAILSELPRGLVDDIKWSLYSNAFHRLRLFAGCDEPFMAALEARLTLVAFTPGEVIFREGEAGQQMYLVRQGVVLLRSWRGDLQRLVREGEVFSELALLPDLVARRHTCTATAVRPTDLVALAGRDLAAACKDHPQSGSLVQERLMQQLEDRLHGTEWTWFIDKVLVPYHLSGDLNAQPTKTDVSFSGLRTQVSSISSQAPPGVRTCGLFLEGRDHDRGALPPGQGSTKGSRGVSTSFSTAGAVIPRSVSWLLPARKKSSDTALAAPSSEDSQAGGVRPPRPNLAWSPSGRTPAQLEITLSGVGDKDSGPGGGTELPDGATTGAAPTKLSASDPRVPSSPGQLISPVSSGLAQLVDGADAPARGAETPGVMPGADGGRVSSSDLHGRIDSRDQQQLAWLLNSMDGPAPSRDAAPALALDKRSAGTGRRQGWGDFQGSHTSDLDRGAEDAGNGRLRKDLGGPAVAAEDGTSAREAEPDTGQGQGQPGPDSPRRVLQSSNSITGSRRILRNVSDLLGSLLDKLWGDGGNRADGSQPRGDPDPDTNTAGHAASFTAASRTPSTTVAGRTPRTTVGSSRTPSTTAAGRTPSTTAGAGMGADVEDVPSATASSARLSGRRRLSRQTAEEYLRSVTQVLPEEVAQPHSPSADGAGATNGGAAQLASAWGAAAKAPPSEDDPPSSDFGMGASAGRDTTTPRVAPASKRFRRPPRRGPSEHWLATMMGDGDSNPRSTSGSQAPLLTLIQPNSVNQDTARGGGIPSLVLKRSGPRPRGPASAFRSGVAAGIAIRAVGRMVSAGLKSETQLTDTAAAEAAAAGGTSARDLDEQAADPREQIRSAMMLLLTTLGAELLPEAQFEGAACGDVAAGGAGAADQHPSHQRAPGSAAGAAGAAASLPTAEMLFSKPCSRRLLVGLADAVVRREGANVPAVRQLLEQRGREVLQAAEARVGQLVGSVASGIDGVEQTVAQLDESLMVANRRLALIERDVMDAQGEGVLAAGLLEQMSGERFGTTTASEKDEGGDGGSGWAIDTAASVGGPGGATSGDLDPLLTALLWMPETERQTRARSNSGFREEDSRLGLQQAQSGGGIGAWSSISRHASRGPSRGVSWRLTSNLSMGPEPSTTDTVGAENMSRSRRMASDAALVLSSSGGGVAGGDGAAGTGSGRVRKCSSGAVATVATASGEAPLIHMLSSGHSRRKSMDASGFIWFQQHGRNSISQQAPEPGAGGLPAGGPPWSPPPAGAADPALPTADSVDTTRTGSETPVGAATESSPRHLHHGLDNTSPAAAPTPMLQGGQPARDRRRSRASVDNLPPYNLSAMPDLEGSAHGGYRYPGDGGSGRGTQSQARPPALRSRRTSIMMMQAGLLLPEATSAALGPGSPSTLATTLVRQRLSHLVAVLDDKIVQDGGAGGIGAGGRNASPGLAPFERPGARRAPSSLRHHRRSSNGDGSPNRPVSASPSQHRASTMNGFAAAVTRGGASGSGGLLSPSGAGPTSRPLMSNGGNFERISDSTDAGQSYASSRHTSHPASRRGSLVHDSLPISRRVSSVGGYDSEMSVNSPARGAGRFAGGD